MRLIANAAQLRQRPAQGYPLARDLKGLAVTAQLYDHIIAMGRDAVVVISLHGPDQKAPPISSASANPSASAPLSAARCVAAMTAENPSMRRCDT